MNNKGPQSYKNAIYQAQKEALSRDSSVVVFGLGADGTGRIFGSMGDLPELFRERVFDVPACENSLTGMALGLATSGMKPVLVHQRLDFSLLGFDQLVNNIAKWRYMFGGALEAPLTIRMIIGRGWGQGPQHSQALHGCFAHIPGLKVLMPSNPSDAYNMLLGAIFDRDPVVFIEHRWLFEVLGSIEISRDSNYLRAKVVRSGTQLTIASISYGVLECLNAAKILEGIGISVEVIDLRCVSPLDSETIIESVKKTGRFIFVDIGHLSFGLASEAISRVAEGCFEYLKAAPRKIGLPDLPLPTSVSLMKHYYPGVSDILEVATEILGLAESFASLNDFLRIKEEKLNLKPDQPHIGSIDPF
jgi:pyruvate/2-oxoglutarate/acetoin dehydrogenase E1 component